MSSEEQEPTYPVEVQRALQNWREAQEAKKEASVTVKDLGKVLQEREEELMISMESQGIDVIDLKNGKVLRVERKLREAKKE